MPGGIEIKTRDEIAYMREASLIVYEVLEELSKAAAPGVTLEELDAIAERETVRRGAVCAFKGLYGFPKNVCISVNEACSAWARSSNAASDFPSSSIFFCRALASVRSASNSACIC